MTDGKRRGHFEGSGGWRKDGRYSWRITLPDGKRRSFYGKTKREAVAKAKQAELDFERGAVVGARDVTVKAYLERWLNDTAADRVRPSTLRSYRGHIEHHILPAFGTVKLRNLTPQHVNAMLAAIVAGGASPTTANRVRATLRTALASALKWGMVSRNVATLADPRREERQRVAPLQPEQLRAFLATLKGHRYEPLMTVAIATGMRQGELLALRWGPDVDLDTGEIRIHHTLSIGKDGKRHLGRPKTEHSLRVIRLSRDAVAALKRQRKAIEGERGLIAAAGTRWQENDLVFPTSIGTFADGPTVTKALQALLDAAGLPRQRFHDLRHATASLHLGDGADLFEVKELLGHSQISLTANTYGHMSKKLADTMASRMDRALGIDTKTEALDTKTDTKRDDTERNEVT